MHSHRRAPQGGFTLIELVVVIVILGILAAFAIPRFANIARDARISALNGVAGSLRSTAALVHGMALARNVINDNPSTSRVQLEGFDIDIVNSYPEASAEGIGRAMSGLDPATFNVVFAGGTATIQMLGAPTPATCAVSYQQPAAAGAPAVINAPVTTGC